MSAVGAERLARAEALLAMLFVPGVVLPSEVILKVGAAHGLDRHAMFAAKKRLGIQARRAGPSWIWFQDSEAPERPAPERPARPACPAAFGSRIEQAEAFLGQLFRPGVELASQEVLAAGAALGISRHPLFDAKKKLGIRARKARGPRTGTHWVWYRDQATAHEKTGPQDHCQDPLGAGGANSRLN